MNKLDMPEKELAMQFEWVQLKSSQLAASGRHPVLSLTRIEFAPRKDGSSGSIYEYLHIEPELYEALVAAESPGGFFKAHIKPFPDRYPYRKIEAEQA